MPQSTKKSRLTIAGDRVGDVIDVTDVRPVEEEDTSVIDRAEAAYAPRVDVEVGTPEATINLYDDPTDTGQAHIDLGASIGEVVWYPVGPETGNERRTYSDCIVTQDDPATVAYKGKYKRVVKIKANGGMVKDTVPA